MPLANGLRHPFLQLRQMARSLEQVLYQLPTSAGYVELSPEPQSQEYFVEALRFPPPNTLSGD